MNFHLETIRWFVYGAAGFVLIGSGSALYFFVKGWEEVKSILGNTPELRAGASVNQDKEG